MGDNPRTSEHIPRCFTVHTKNAIPQIPGILQDTGRSVQAPSPFQGRIHLLLNEILEGKFDCDHDLLMAKAILFQKDDKVIAILDHYRPIALLNTTY